MAPLADKADTEEGEQESKPSARWRRAEITTQKMRTIRICIEHYDVFDDRKM